MKKMLHIPIARVEKALKNHGTRKIGGKTYHALGEEYYSKEDAQSDAAWFRQNGYNARVYNGPAWGRYRIGVARRKTLSTKRRR